jgi:thiamine pyrophosphate-dependent acetolactate synthase large subunit-like protein
MHASMAIYDAYCDRVPMMIIGATGPVDAARRRPWIDWIHTSADQGALIRNYSKWDDQPGSVEAALGSLARAYSITREAPSAPVYVCLDVSLQEQPLSTPPVIPDVRRDRSPRSHGPDAVAIGTTLEYLGQAHRPLFLLGRLGRGEQDWDRRVALAERYGAMVVSDLKNGAVFPTRHRLHPHPPGIFLPAAAAKLIGAADLILSLDWVDLAGTISAAASHGYPASARIISCTMDSALHNASRVSGSGRSGTPGSARPSPTPIRIWAPSPVRSASRPLVRSATVRRCPPRWPRRSPARAPGTACWSTFGSVRMATRPSAASRQRDSRR